MADVTRSHSPAGTKRKGGVGGIPKHHFLPDFGPPEVLLSILVLLQLSKVDQKQNFEQFDAT